MHRRLLPLWQIALLFGFTIGFSSLVRADERIVDPIIYGIQSVTGDCINEVIVVVEFYYTAATNDDAGNDWYTFVLYDGNGIAVAGGQGGTPMGGHGNGINVIVIPFHKPTKRPFTAKLHDISQPFPPTEAAFKNGPVIASYTFDPIAYNENCRALPPEPIPAVKEDRPPDDRVNWRMGDLYTVIYPAWDDVGNPALHIYDVNERSRGVFMFALTEADLNPYLETPPEQNRLVKEGEGIAVYVLTTGEIQFNIGPDAEGKTVVVIVDGLTVTRVNHYLY